MELDELIATACPTIGDLGWAFYFVPETAARAESLGLDIGTFYFVGRGGVLGDVEATVVQSAFGYFEPVLLTGMWDAGRNVLSPRDAGREFMAAAQEFGRRHFAKVAELDRFCAAAEAVVAAAPVAGLSLFAAAAAEPLCGDLPGRAMQLVSVLRELRGSAHLVAIVASGLEPKKAHYLRRPTHMALFGYGQDDTPDITPSDRQKLLAADQLTDDLVRPAYGALDDSGRKDLVAGLERLQAVLALSG